MERGTIRGGEIQGTHVYDLWFVSGSLFVVKF